MEKPFIANPAASGRLPVATSTEVRVEARRLFRQHRGAMTLVLSLHALAALAGLVAPPVLGHLVQGIDDHTLTLSDVNRFAVLLAGTFVLQAILTRYARYSSFVLGERVFAELREQFVNRVLALPLSTVERAGTGDLIARTTNDIDALSETVRFAVPAVLVASVTTVLTVAATFAAGPLVALPVFVGVPALWFSTRWYLRRAPDRVPGRARGVRRAQRHHHRDGRGRPDHRCAEPAVSPGRPDPAPAVGGVRHRAVHVVAAADLVPHRGSDVPAAGRVLPAVGRLPRVARPRRRRLRDRGDPVRRPARGAPGRAAVVAGRGAGRRVVAGSHRRRGQGPAGPDGVRGRAGGRADRGPRGVVRVPRGP